MPLSHSQILEGFECSGSGDIIFKSHCQKRKMDMDLCGERNIHELSESGDCKAQYEPKVSFPKRKCLWSTKSSHHHIENFGDQDTSPGCLKDSSLTSSLSSTSNFSSSSCHSSASSSSAVPLPRNMGSNNLALHFLSCIQHREQENTSSLNNNNPTAVSETVWSCDDELMEEEKDLMQNVDDNKRVDGCNNNHLTDIHLTGLHRSSVEDNGSMNTMDSDFFPDTTQYASSPIPVSAPQDIDYGDSVRTCAFLSCSGLKPSPVSGRLHCHCSASWRGMYGIDNGYITDYY
ncbi:unnamed protein product [Lymnaea stagnalis]|uniref:Uncharacterized protein n=1 Tax=Lymnaea stagnalis TaxID=6523 RepID=A0AAV2HII8_LYMST